MGLFGGGKSSSSSAASQAGSQTQLGNPITLATNVGDDGGQLYATINQVDHGSVARSFALADDSLSLGYWLMNEVLDASDGVLARNDAAAARLLAAGGGASKDILSAGRLASSDILNKSAYSGNNILSAVRGSSLDMLSKSFDFSTQLLEAGKQGASAVERVSESLQSFVNDQNNPNESNQMLLIVGAFAVLAVVVMVKK